MNHLVINQSITYMTLNNMWILSTYEYSSYSVCKSKTPSTVRSSLAPTNHLSPTTTSPGPNCTPIFIPHRTANSGVVHALNGVRTPSTVLLSSTPVSTVPTSQARGPTQQPIPTPVMAAPARPRISIGRFSSMIFRPAQPQSDPGLCSVESVGMVCLCL